MKRLDTKSDSPLVGVEWTESLEKDFIESVDRLGCFELIPDNFFYGKRKGFLRQLGDTGLPVLVHGVELSVGSAEPLKQDLLDRMHAVASQVNCINFSDHLCMTEAGGVEIGQLTPLPWSVENADRVCRKIEQVQKQLSVPFLIENVANRFMFSETDLTETEFINLVLKNTGCQLLLDLHNLHTNSFNFDFDPYEWLDEIDMKSVNGIHLAGGYIDDEGMMVDGHSDLVPERVWDFYRTVCARVTPRCTIVEWTENPPAFDILLGDVDRARTIVEAAPSPVPWETASLRRQGAFV